jgi:hypothetical protein
MRRVGLIDITVGNATRLGASQRSTTRRCASHHIATQRVNRWGHPAALAPLAADGHPQAPVAPRQSCAARAFFVAQSWAECITNMPGFHLRQAQPRGPWCVRPKRHCTQDPQSKNSAYHLAVHGARNCAISSSQQKRPARGSPFDMQKIRQISTVSRLPNFARRITSAGAARYPQPAQEVTLSNQYWVCSSVQPGTTKRPGRRHISAGTNDDMLARA